METLSPFTLLFSAISAALLFAPLDADAAEPAGENISIQLEETRSESGAPGVVALAFQDGEILAWGVAGVRAQGSAAPLALEDPMHMGSCSKAMTSTMIAHLIEKEVLTWETTIAEAMPEFAKQIDEGYHAVTIEALLKHQAGIAERRRPEIAAHHEELETLEGTPPEVRRLILAKVLATPPSPSAAGTYDYSNFGYMTAGAMVETLTGTPWEELMEQELFEPMKMSSAGVGSPSGEHVPVGHTLVDGELVAMPPGPAGILPTAMGPAGLVHCNLRDWSTFVAEHLAGERGDDGFLKAETYQRLHLDHKGSRYAAGWALGQFRWDWGEGATLEHNGSDNTWFSVVLAIPEFDLTLVIATNCAGTPANRVTQGARRLLLTAAGFKD